MLPRRTSRKAHRRFSPSVLRTFEGVEHETATPCLLLLRPRTRKDMSMTQTVFSGLKVVDPRELHRGARGDHRALRFRRGRDQSGTARRGRSLSLSVSHPSEPAVSRKLHLAAHQSQQAEHRHRPEAGKLSTSSGALGALGGRARHQLPTASPAGDSRSRTRTSRPSTTGSFMQTSPATAKSGLKPTSPDSTSPRTGRARA